MSRKDASTSIDEALDDDVKLFHQCAARAVDLSSAHVDENGILTVIRSVRDWEQNKRQKYLYTIDTKSGLNVGFPSQLHDSIAWRLPSPSGRKVAILKQEAAPSDSSSGSKLSQVLEIWDRQSLVKRIKINEKKHGKIINDPDGFGRPVWNPTEDMILYSAERIAPQSTSFWDGDAGEKERGATNVLGKGKGEEWGEQHVGQAALLDLFLLHVGSARVERVTNVPGTYESSNSLGGVTLGQAVFHPSGESIAYTGWDAGELGDMPRRLGFLFCRNRPSNVYTSSISELKNWLNEEVDGSADKLIDDSEFVCVTSDQRLSRSPRYATFEDKSTLVLLSNKNGFDSHEGCMGLYRYDESSLSLVEVLPPVGLPRDDGPKVCGMGFPGLFVSQLPYDCGCIENHILASTLWGSIVKIVKICLQDGEVELVGEPETELNSSSTIQSRSLLCASARDNKLIATTVSSNKAAEVIAFDLMRASGSDTKLLGQFSPLSATYFSALDEGADFHLDDVDVEVVTSSSTHIDGAVNIPLQSILMMPKNQKEKVPLIVIPHGGPHSCSATSYIPGPAYLCAAGYAILLPNYRGSTGFGQAAVESLLTRIGELDVEDVMSTTKDILEKKAKNIDESRIGVCGGSHGGFLAGHLTGQFPKFFKAAVMRNPVTNIATMTTATDIVDWCYTEACGKYYKKAFRGPNKEELSIMWDKSPISHATNVQTPTLVALGMVDLRVPPSQGLEWYHSLRSRSIPTKLLKYPDDSHALSNVCTEADHWINIKRWFDEHLL